MTAFEATEHAAVPQGHSPAMNVGLRQSGLHPLMRASTLWAYTHLGKGHEEGAQIGVQVPSCRQVPVHLRALQQLQHSSHSCVLISAYCWLR